MQVNDLRPKTHDGCQRYDSQLTQLVVVLGIGIQTQILPHFLDEMASRQFFPAIYSVL